jgi:hypothetical protein
MLSPLSAARTGCCDSVYAKGATGANWVSAHAKTAAASFSETMKNVGTAVSSFFTKIAVKLGAAFVAAKAIVSSGWAAAKGAYTALPKEGKIFVGASVAVTALAAMLLGCVCKKAPAAPAATTATATVTAPPTSTTPAANTGTATATTAAPAATGTAPDASATTTAAATVPATAPAAATAAAPAAAPAAAQTTAGTAAPATV